MRRKDWLNRQSAVGSRPSKPWFNIKSSKYGIQWPAVPGPMGSQLLAVQQQLDISQWWPAEVLWEQQQQERERLLTHALETVPFYRDRFRRAGLTAEAALKPAQWRTIPIFHRRDLQEAGTAPFSKTVPKIHGRVAEAITAGAAGRPVATRSTEVARFLWLAYTLRDHLWHRRHFHGKLVIAQPESADVTDKIKRNSNWGAPVNMVFASGPSALLNCRVPLDRQADKLRKENPHYLLTRPSILRELARAFKNKEWELPQLREVRTFGESLDPDLRTLCRETFGVPLVDLYGSMELGPIALQCPESGHYHVQAENLLLEVLNEAGEPCKPGETGEMVVTTLHNYAAPLIRCRSGDYAEVADSCGCGRGLPTLRRIIGNRRDLMVLQDGSRFQPLFPVGAWAKVAPIRQIQLVQKSVEEVEARLVAAQTLTTGEAQALKSSIGEALGHPFNIAFRYLEEITRDPGGPFQEIICEVPQ